MIMSALGVTLLTQIAVKRDKVAAIVVNSFLFWK